MHAGQVAAGNMAGFVRDDANQLVRTVGCQQKAGMEENLLTASDECVQRR